MLAGKSAEALRDKLQWKKMLHHTQKRKAEHLKMVLPLVAAWKISRN